MVDEVEMDNAKLHSVAAPVSFVADSRRQGGLRGTLTPIAASFVPTGVKRIRTSWVP